MVKHEPLTVETLPARRKLVLALSAISGLGVVGTAIPFVLSMSPSARARAAGAPVEADVSPLAQGQLMTVEWQGKPVWILRRTAEMISRLQENAPLLADPQSLESQQPAYCRNPWRSRTPELLISVGICTHLGCVPSFRPEQAPADLGEAWPGGFYCPCHGSKFDLSGRVFKRVPAPTNLEIPRYRFLSASTLLIGADDEQV